MDAAAPTRGMGGRAGRGPCEPDQYPHFRLKSILNIPLPLATLAGVGQRMMGNMRATKAG